MKISVEGADPDQASFLVVLLHGGGASALDFLALSQELEADDEIAYLAPQALSRRWFELGPGESRGLAEPHFTISVKSVLGLLERHAAQKMMLVGFAEGAGVVAELLASPELPSKVRAAWLASGGPAGEPEEWPELPPLGLPLLISGLRDDPALGEEKISSAVRYFEKAGARVQRHLEDGRDPFIGPDELAKARKILAEARR